MILEVSEHDEIHLDLFRIIDLYTLFPHLIKEIKPFPNQLRMYKKFIKDIPDPYERIGNIKRVMFELEGVQTTALQNLLAKGFIDLEAFKLKKIRRSKISLPSIISDEINRNDIATSEWFKMLVNSFYHIKVKGKAGLKSRTGLMEFRYDLEKS
ncbi:ABC-three component system middle component 5 [Marinomonas sp. ef1]|uniref:ABC-three component system middle component 5 n=1 Tax=Marinomonas sp. ef1 TaxID=2005043 RepID=UPI0012FDA8CB|nr:ABC-three component system middle component 5 [Marinomonas sp. ef1]